MINYKSYKICQKCLGAIKRGGVSVHSKIGLGYKKEGKNYHRSCWNKIKGREIIIKSHI